MYLRVAPSARAANSLLLLPPFPPPWHAQKPFAREPVDDRRVISGIVHVLAVAPEAHTEGGWQTATARHCGHRGQDRPGRGGGSPDADL
jgi:hypothetical protein